MTTLTAVTALGSRRAAAPVGAACGLALVVAATLGLAGPTASAHRAGPIAPPAPAADRPAAQPLEALPSPAAVAEPGLRRFTGLVGADLSESLDDAGVPAAAAREYVRQMLGAARLADGLSVADRFDLVLATAPGAAPMLVYAGLDRVGRSDVQLMKWTDGKRTVWLDAAGLAREDSGIGLPVDGRITSRFGGRMHPVLGYFRFHKGLDLAAPSGTPIRAAASGRVTSAGWRGGYGRMVSLAHGGGLETDYGHMSRIAARAGEQVRRGEVIGYVGSTGLSTGPHLHFEVRRGGVAVNPLSARMASPIALQGEQLHAFRDQLRYVLELPRAAS